MGKDNYSLADAKAHFSELINRVAYGNERITITKHGKPVAVISNASVKGLGAVKGWLDDKDPFFKNIEQIEKRRHSGKLRAAKRK
jgi:prevent-host-death family protein